MAWPGTVFTVVFGGLFFVAGVGIVAASLRRFRKAGSLLRMRSKPVSDLSTGELATVHGEVVALSPARIPGHALDAEGVAVTARVESIAAVASWFRTAAWPPASPGPPFLPVGAKGPPWPTHASRASGR